MAYVFRKKGDALRQMDLLRQSNRDPVWWKEGGEYHVEDAWAVPHIQMGTDFDKLDKERAAMEQSARQWAAAWEDNDD
jgi:hypothetical protein